MFGDEPNFLPVGTEVSAKYRGAFCEAKVKKIVRNVRCKITLKDTGTRVVVQDEELQGKVRNGHIVDVKHPDTGQVVACIVNKISDMSTYTVVFNDGDENTLRRTQLCLKGEKHFVKSDTLDELPLTNPEHFGTPVMRGSRTLKSKRMMHDASSSETDSDMDSSDDDLPPGRTRGRSELRNMIGHVICLEVEDRKKTLWVPALVVQPTADTTVLKAPDHILVKSFKDSKFYAVSRRAIKEFTREMALKNDDKMLKSAYEKALQYNDNHDLPQTWDREDLLGSDEEETDEEEPSEERDRFVAQLYKFMDDRGTPMNKSPQVASKDLNLYKLFRLVQAVGGYNRVTNQMKWHVICAKMNLPTPTTATSNQLKVAYKKYLHAFEDFDRKLGCTMGTITRPRIRHSSGRNILSFRERDRESTPKSPRRSKKHRDEEEEEIRSSKDVSDRSDVESIKSDRIRSRLDAMLNVSDSEGDSADGRPTTRDSSRSSRARDESARSLTREDLKRARDEASKSVEEEKSREDKTVPDNEDKEEGRQPKKRSVRKKEPDEIKDEPTEDKKDEKKEDKKGKRKVKEETSSEPSESKENSEDEDESEKMGRGKAEFDIGVKLRIKYGKGKTQKIYEAKIVESRMEAGAAQYKVHYAGWNIRYDEWIKRDRIVGAVDEGGKLKHKPPTLPPKPMMTPKTAGTPKPVGTPKPAMTPKPMMTQKTLMTPKHMMTPKPSGSSKPVMTPKPTATPKPKSTNIPTPAGKKLVRKNTTTPSPNLTKEKEKEKDKEKEKEKEKEPVTVVKPTPTKASQSPSTSSVTKTTTASKTPGNGGKGARPTRSTSTDCSLAAGIPNYPVPAKRGLRRNSGMGDESSSRVSDTDSDGSDDSDEEVEEVPERVTRSRRDVDSKIGSGSDSHSDSKKTEPAVTKTTKEPIVDVKPEVKEEIKSEPEVEVKKPAVATPTKVTVKKESKTIDKTIDDVIASGAAAAELEEQEAKSEKKPDEKIYDFEDSSSQDSFKGATRGVAQEPKDVAERGRFRRKEMVKKTRVRSSDSAASNDSTKATTPSQETKDICEPAKLSKDTLRSGKKAADTKPEPEKKVEPEKKKPAPKAKDTKESEEKEKAKPKVLPKSDTPKPRGKRKIDTPDSPKVEEVEKKKPRRKKDAKEEEKPEEEEEKPSEPEPLAEPTMSEPSKPEPTLPDPSWSPTYIPAPTLTQTVSIETKPERDVQDVPAPQLSPIASVSTIAAPHAHIELLQSIPMRSLEPEAVVMDNTPPTTPEGSPAPPTTGGTSPVQIEDIGSMQSLDEPEEDGEEEEEEEEIVNPPPGGESPTVCNTSTLSNSSGGSSGNAPGSESEETGSTLKRSSDKGPEDDGVEKSGSAKKRRKRQSKGGEKCAKKSGGKNSMSDSDESEVKSPEPNRSLAMATGMSSPPHRHIQRTPKYNFLNLEEGKYLEGEERIEFLVGKIQDVRKMYMSLKSEVACIDRRRKRHRRKLNEAAATMAAAAAVAAVCDRGEAMLS